MINTRAMPVLLSARRVARHHRSSFPTVNDFAGALGAAAGASSGAVARLIQYFPYPIKVWVNGHEWAKRQATRDGIAFTELSNGFATCEDPAALQAICDRLGPGAIQVFFQRWLARLPLPLTEHDRAGGY